MARRYVTEQPVSKLAIWSRRTAWFALAATLLVIIIVRASFLEIKPALATFAGALGFAVIALALAVAAFVAIWREGLAGLGAALTGVLVSIALLAYPAYLGVKAYKLPWIYDITTDPIDPPRYEALARIRPRDANPIIYAGLSAAEQQRTAYPDIESMEQVASPKVAYEAALGVLSKRKWAVLLKRPPEGRRDGQIEAVARSPIMGFRDDIVVRIRAEARGSRIDVRSSSRYGTFDFGSNAQRIRALIDDIDDAIGDEKPERPPPPPAKKQKNAPKTNQPPAKR